MIPVSEKVIQKYIKMVVAAIDNFQAILKIVISTLERFEVKASWLRQF